MNPATICLLEVQSICSSCASLSSGGVLALYRRMVERQAKVKDIGKRQKEGLPPRGVWPCRIPC